MTPLTLHAYLYKSSRFPRISALLGSFACSEINVWIHLSSARTMDDARSVAILSQSSDKSLPIFFWFLLLLVGLLIKINHAFCFHFCTIHLDKTTPTTSTTTTTEREREDRETLIQILVILSMRCSGGKGFDKSSRSETNVFIINKSNEPAWERLGRVKLKFCSVILCFRFEAALQPTKIYRLQQQQDFYFYF